MSFVADFFEDVGGGLVDLVEDVGGGLVDIVEDVGGAIGDAVEWVADEVIEPVVKTVGQVVQSAIDDPLKTIAQIAAVATGQAWALPLIEAADVAIAGGDIGDVLLSAATTFVAGEVGSFVGDLAGEWAGDLVGEIASEGTKEVASEVAKAVVGGAAGSGAVAVITGRDPLQAIAAGGISGGVGALLGQVEGFDKLNKTHTAAARVVSAAVSSALTGQNPTQTLVQSLISASGIVSEVISSFDPDGTRLSKAQSAIISDILMGTATAAITGGSASNVVRGAMIKAGTQALGQMVSSGLKNLIDDTTKAYESADATADQIQANQSAQQKAADGYNGLKGELDGRINEQTRLVNAANAAKAAYDANPTDANYNAAIAAKNAADGYVTQLNADYANKYRPGLDGYKSQLDNLKVTYAELTDNYEKLIDVFTQKTETLTEKLDPYFYTSNRAFVEAMDPNFKADEYRKLNGLSANADVYEHYLNTGQFEGAYTNEKAAAAELSAQRTRLVNAALQEAGIDPTTVDPAGVAKVLSKIDSKYGDNLAAMKSATAQDVIRDNSRELTLLKKDQDDGILKVDIAGVSYGDWNKPSTDKFVMPAGMRYATQDEHVNGTAKRTYADDGNVVWIAEDASSAPTVWDPAKVNYVKQVSLTKDLPQVTAANQLLEYGSNPDKWSSKVSKSVLNGSQTLVDWAKETGNSTLINTAANLVKAGGGFLTSINGISALAGYAPPSTALGKFANQLENIGKAGNTAEYKAAIDNINTMVKDAKGVGGTLKAIYNGFKSAPLEFLAEYIGVEGFQEIAPFLIGGVAAGGAKGAALALKYSNAIATRIGKTAGITAAMTSDIVESAGGAADSAYKEAYQTAVKSGMSEYDADRFALGVAQQTALVAGLTTAVTFGIGGAALEKAVFGKATTSGFADAIDLLGKAAKEGTKITIKEGVTEAGEEGITQAFVESQLYKIDPTRDVAANITAAAAFGAIAGGPIAGGTYAGYLAGDVVSNALMGNAFVADAVQNSPSAAAATTALNNLGLKDKVIQTNLLNTKYDADYTSTAEAQEALAARTDFDASSADIEALTGATKDANLTAEVEKYVDPRVLDAQEAKEAAGTENYTLSQADVDSLIGQKDEAAAVAEIKKKYDPLAVTTDEAKQFFAEQNYTPNQQEFASYLGNRNEAATKTEIDTKYDPIAVTRDEAKEFFKGQNYTPNEKELTDYMGNRNEAATKTEIDKVYDPLAVTEEEAQGFFKSQGYTPDAATFAKYLGNRNEVDTDYEIGINFDRLAVNEEEAKEFFDTIGYKPSKEELAAFVGNRDEAETRAAIEAKYDPLSVTEAEASSFFTEQGFDIDPKELAKYIGNKSEADVRAQIGTNVDASSVNEDEVRQFFATYGKTPTDEDYANYIGNKNEAATKAEIDARFDPIQVTEQEARDFFAEQGYTPDAKTLADYIGLKDEAATKAAIAAKYDPLAVTKEEALAAAKAENYTLSDQEIANYLGNKSEADTLAAIVKYVDPKAVTEAEAKAFFAEQGYPPSQKELAAYIGQKDELQIAKDIATYADPKAVTEAEAKEYFAKLGYPATDAQIKQFAKVADETQVQKDVATYVDPRQVTAAEAEKFLTDLGYKPTKEDIDKFVKSSVDVIQDATKGEAAKYVDPLLVDRDEVKQAFIDAGFPDVTDEDVARFIGQYSEDALSGKVVDYLPIATYKKTQLELNDVKDSLLDKMEEYEAAGIKRDDALDKAIDDVAKELGTTKDQILDVIGAPAVADNPATAINEAKAATGIYSDLANLGTDLSEQISDVSKDVQDKYNTLTQGQKDLADALTKQGVDLNTAIDTAKTQLSEQITGVSQDLQTKYNTLTQGQKDLADALTKQGVDLNTAIDTAKTSLQQDIKGVQEQIGTKGAVATQSDLDAVINLLQQNGAYDATLDYNGDRVIDQNDKIALEQALKTDTTTGTNVDWRPVTGSKWAPTGVYAEIANAQRAAEEAAARTAAQNAQNARRLAQLGNVNSLMGMLSQASDIGGQQVTVKSPDPANIRYLYDWSSIFATPSQEQMFLSPYGAYAQGGMVREDTDDINDELLKILRG